jgi:glycosyltransferase involved in cell wall biosynthesis
VLNEERWLPEALAAMRAQETDGELEFLFADGGSTDRTREILDRTARADGRIRVLDNPRRVTPSGLNVALGQARGDYVARMDAHSFYPPDYLRRAVERLRRGDTRWVSGPVIPRPIGRVSRALALALTTPLGHGGARKWAGEGTAEEVDLDTGVFGGVWRRETVMAYGGWDEHWPQNQDAELAGRFLGRGERLVCLSAMGAQYVPRDTLRGLWRQYRNYGFYRVATARRHPHSMRRSHVLPPALVLTLAAAVVAPRRPRRLARAGVGLYAALLAREAGRAGRHGAGPGDALTVPLVLAAMHLGNGVGVLRGVARFGLPGAAVARAAGLRGLARKLAPPPADVYAPSLGDRCA